MAGYGPKDFQFAEFYDCYTILVAMTLEDAGFAKKGEIGPFYEATDTTYKGTFPINTDGGQLSAGQPGLAGGFRLGPALVGTMVGNRFSQGSSCPCASR